MWIDIERETKTELEILCSFHWLNRYCVVGVRGAQHTGSLDVKRLLEIWDIHLHIFYSISLQVEFMLENFNDAIPLLSRPALWFAIC